MLFYSNYDETQLWHDGVVNGYAFQRENPADGMVEIASNVDGFTGSVLKYSPTDDSWYLRILTMQHASLSYNWTPLAMEADEYYEIFFDYEIVGPESANTGFYYTTAPTSGEVLLDNTRGKKHFSWTVKGSEFTIFAVGYWPGYDKGCTMYIDNYGIRKTSAPTQA